MSDDKRIKSCFCRGGFIMKRNIEYDDLYEITQDINGIKSVLLHVEASEYFKGAEEDTILLRAIRNSLEFTGKRIEGLIEEYNLKE